MRTGFHAGAALLGIFALSLMATELSAPAGPAAVKQVKAFDPTIKMLSNEDCTIVHYRLPEVGPHRFTAGVRRHIMDRSCRRACVF